MTVRLLDLKVTLEALLWRGMKCIQERKSMLISHDRTPHNFGNPNSFSPILRCSNTTIRVFGDFKALNVRSGRITSQTKLPVIVRRMRLKNGFTGKDRLRGTFL